jgi:S1-C subfamily serine protease
MKNHKLYFVCIILLLILKIDILLSQEINSIKLYQQCSSSIVVIEVPNGTASGFFITKDGWIISNKHVIEDDSLETYNQKDIKITLKDSSVFYPIIVDVAKDFEQLDISLLKIDIKNAPFLKLLADGDAHIGENIVTIGHPERLNWTITKGIVSNYYENNFLQMAIATNSGNSGGPVINSTGYVVGVHTMGFKMMQLTNFSTKISKVRKILKKRGVIK